MVRRLTVDRWFFLTGSSGLAVVALSLAFWERPQALVALWLSVLVAVTELLQARLVKGEKLSFSTSLSLAAIWFFGPTTAMLAMMSGVTAVGLLRRNEPRIILFNTGQTAWRVAIAAALFHSVGAPGPLGIGFLASALVYAGLNIAVMGVAFALHRNEPVLAVCMDHVEHTWVQWIERFLLAIVFWLLLRGLGLNALHGVAAVVLFASLVSRFTAHRAQERAVDRLLSLAGARAPYRVRRSERMIQLAGAICRELEAEENVARDLRHAILLQDIGLDPELERRLEQPGPLSPQERRALLAHPEASARLISQIGDLVPVARIVRHGFERFDGFGYPDGLSGEAIPFASRILSVVRAFEAMTSGRAYRPARPPAEALEELKREAGRQFDPRVVEACVRVLERDPHLALAGGVDEAMEQLRAFLSGTGGSRNLTYSSTLVGMSSLAQSLSESLSLETTLNRVTSVVGRLAGWPNLILLAEDETGDLVCRAAWGFSGDSLAGWTVPAGQGLAGQAAWARQPLYAADFIAELKQERPDDVAPFLQAAVRSALAIPMTARGRTTGVLCVFKGEAAPFTPDQTNLLSAVAGEAALALENARLFTEVQRRYVDLVTMQAFTNILLRETNSAIVALDAEGRVRQLNHAARAMLGGRLAPDEPVEGRLWADVAEDEVLVQPLLEVLATGTPQDIYGATLTGLVVDVHISPLRDGPRLIGVVCMAHDVTEYRKMQEHLKQVEKLAAVGELAAGAAHEIRNPLTTVRGFVQLLNAQGQRGPGQEYAELILGEIDRIDSILEDLLTLARPTSPNRRWVDLHQLLDEVVLLVQAKEAAREVTIHKEWGAAAAGMQVDPRQMKQVFLNILTNAVEALEGRGEIVLTTSLSSQGELVMTCRDTGPGILPEVLPRIFDPFFTTKDTGTGLGLAVSFRIVQAHGGRVEAESEGDLGTTFRVILPRLQHANSQVQPQPAPFRPAAAFAQEPSPDQPLAADSTLPYGDSGEGNEGGREES